MYKVFFILQKGQALLFDYFLNSQVIQNKCKDIYCAQGDTCNYFVTDNHVLTRDERTPIVFSMQLQCYVVIIGYKSILINGC